MIRTSILRALGVLAVATPLALAQTPSPAPTLVSPEVRDSQTVTFRLNAPKATEVALRGDWFTTPKPMTQGADGVWTLTLESPSPSKYIYNYVVDGVTIADPANPQVKLRQQGQGSFFTVPAQDAGLWDAQHVPHGAVEVNAQQSSVLGESREFLVYTPPGYAQNPNRQYPVLYLQHGSNDRPQGWIDIGNLNYLADNLIAAQRARPMIIVMPVAHALPMGAPGAGARNAEVFNDYLLQDVIPAVESKYRVAKGRENRAIAGFSMGGDISLRVFARHPEMFSAIGVLSPAPRARAVPEEMPATFADAQRFNQEIDAFYLACGRQDGLFPVSEALHASLDQLAIEHVWRPTEGYHNYALWRQHAAEFLPLIFPERR